MMAESRYLDVASVWPLRPEARQAWIDAVELGLGDPERAHGRGRRARELLDRADAATAEVLGAPDDALVWTSGGTEAVHLAMLGSARSAERRGEQRRHLIVSAVEHSSVLRAAEHLRDTHGYTLDLVGVDRAGVVDPDEVAGLLRDDTLAVHVQHANHEVGAIQPTHEIARHAHRVGAIVHVDACQSVGQIGLTLDQLGADLVSASAAKFGGPPGVGLLVLGPEARIDPLLEGDQRQRRRRAGLVDTAAIAAAAVALQVAHAGMQREHSTREIVRRHLRQALTDVEDVEIHGPLADAHPGIVALSALYVDGASLVSALDELGFMVHSGSSCATGTGQPSHVLAAMGVLTHGHVRVSFGPEATIDDADAFVAAYRTVVERLRATAGMRRR
jgi:cysteine desulfurase